MTQLKKPKTIKNKKKEYFCNYCKDLCEVCKIGRNCWYCEDREFGSNWKY